VARVVLEHLTKLFHGPNGETIRAVDALSLTVEDKELMVLVGPSGCGKTTTLRLLAGLEEPSAGEIRFDGQIVNRLPPKERDVAMVFQSPALYPHLSVYENIAFGLQIRKAPREEIARRVHESAEILGLKDCLNRLAMELSGGQRQRVAVGRALVRRPRLFLFDEPLSNLDAQTRLRMRAELARLHAELGWTSLYVTHDQDEAMNLGERIAVLDQGVLQQVAEPVKIYREPANMFVAGFFGSPPMNFFEGTLAQAGPGLAFEERPTAGTPLRFILNGTIANRAAGHTGKKVLLGLRPDNIGDKPVGSSSLPVSVMLERFEFRGGDTYAHLVRGKRSIVARLADPAATPKQPLEVHFDLSQAHLFDPHTRARIA
jgi:multiple sugar transport system ATP-binding protein